MEIIEKDKSTFKKEIQSKAYNEFLNYLEIDPEEFKFMNDVIDFDDYSR